MKLTMQIIADYLDPQYESPLNGDASSPALLGVSLYGDNLTIMDDYVYVAAGSELPPQPAQAPRRLIVCGDMPPLYHEYHGTIIHLENGAVTETLYEVQRIFNKFINYYLTMQGELNAGADIQRLCDITHEILENPIDACDANYNILAICGGFHHLFPEKAGDTNFVRSIPKDLIAILNNDPDYVSNLKSLSPQLYDGKSYPFRVISVNLFGGLAYAGQVCVVECHKKFRPSDYEIINYLTESIRILLSRKIIAGSRYNKTLRRFVSGIFHRKIENNDESLNFLQQAGWNAQDEYLCLKVEMEYQDIYPLSFSYCCNCIEETIRNSCAFEYEDHIIAVVPQRDKSMPEEDIFGAFDAFIRDFRLKCGVSNQFPQLWLVGAYARQSAIALEMGKRYNPALNRYNFADYALSYLLQNGVRSLTPELFCCPGFLKLRELSQNGAVDYYTTLKVYLQSNMNLLDTAKSLFIHRTTLFYRLKRIKDLINLNLDDHAVRQRLMISFMLLENQAGAGG